MNLYFSGHLYGSVRQAYLDRAQHFAQRMRVINASRSLPEIQKTLEEIIKTI